MRKQIMQYTSDEAVLSPPWLDVASLAHVELTSEDPASPIDAVLLPQTSSGWRAAQPGEQVIRLVFDRPQALHHLRLVFAEAQQTRTQEFVVRWSADGGQSYREIVRQQYTFVLQAPCTRSKTIRCGSMTSRTSSSASSLISRGARRVPPCRNCGSGNA